MRLLAPLFASLLLSLPALPADAPKKAGPTQIVGAAMTRNLDGTFDVRVTVRSRDTGPDYYADRIEFLDAEGKVLHLHRVAQPHVNKQPFSETIQGMQIPKGVDAVTIRARMRPGGAYGKERTIKVPRKK